MSSSRDGGAQVPSIDPASETPQWQDRLNRVRNEVRARARVLLDADAQLGRTDTEPKTPMLVVDDHDVIIDCTPVADALLGRACKGEKLHQVISPTDTGSAQSPSPDIQEEQEEQEPPEIRAEQFSQWLGTASDGTVLTVLEWLQGGSGATTNERLLLLVPGDPGASRSLTDSILAPLVRSVAHEFNNVLATMVGYTELALIINKNDRVDRYLGEVYEGGKRGQVLVEDVQQRLNELGLRIDQQARLQSDPEVVKASDPAKRVLVVDDDPGVASYLGELLRSVGYETEVCTDSREALVLFNQNPHRFDTVVVDQRMPGLLGSDLIREFVAIRPKLPVILCTGSGDTVITAEDGLHAVFSLVTKPIDQSRFLQIIAKAVSA